MRRLKKKSLAIQNVVLCIRINLLGDMNIPYDLFLEIPE